MFFLSSYHLLAYHKIYLSVMLLVHDEGYKLLEGRHCCLFFLSYLFFPQVFGVKTKPVGDQ